MSIGSATYDIFVRIPRDIVERGSREAFTLPLGAKVRVEEVVETCGGGACNTAVGLARLGCGACFEGAVGSDQWGKAILENFHREGVDSVCALIVDGDMTSFSIILIGKGGERVILYEPGTNARLHPVNFDRAKAETMDWIYLNRIHEDSCEIQDELIDIVGNGDAGLTWNPGGCQIDRGLAAEKNRLLAATTEVLLLNKEEAIAFAKTSSDREALKILLDAGAGNVCITDGSNGTLGSDGKHIYRCPAVPNPQIVDTTGAGDAFGIGATYALIRGFSLPEALKAGSMNAASVIGRIGAQAGLLTDIEMEQQLHETALDVETLSSI